MKHYYLLSDSHSRSFSYNPTFIPLFIGPGKTNLLITKRQHEKTKQKVLEIVSVLDKNIPIILSLNEPNLRVYLDEYKDSFENDSIFIETIIEHYIDILLAINQKVEMVITCPAFPRESKEYTALALRYNNILEKKIDSTNIKYLDFTSNVTNIDGTINEGYKADHIHANHKLGDSMARMLGGKECDGFSWEFNYTFESFTRAKFSIWGDFPKECLVYDGSQPRDWEKLHLRTKATDKLISILLSFRVKKLLGARTVFIMNSKEGYIPFSFYKKGLQCFCYEESVVAKNLLDKINFHKQVILYERSYRVCDISIIIESLYNGEIPINVFDTSKYCFIIIENRRIKTFCSELEQEKVKRIRLNADYSVLLMRGNKVVFCDYYAVYIAMLTYNFYDKLKLFFQIGR